MEGELTAPVMTKDEFERQQAVELYHEKAARAVELWDMVLSQLSSSTHKWKWEYMDYLEDIKYQDTADVTLEMAKEDIMSYEEFAEVKDAEKAIQEQISETVEDSKIAAIQTASIDELLAIVVSEEADVEIPETEEKVSEDTEVFRKRLIILSCLWKNVLRFYLCLQMIIQQNIMLTVSVWDIRERR